jgi:hypothetical protein
MRPWSIVVDHLRGADALSHWRGGIGQAAAETKIAQFHSAGGGEQYVTGLDVAVDDSVVVGESNGAARALHDGEHEL